MAAPRNENLKNSILSAALKLLQTTSFGDISLAAIAKQAKLSKGTLYYYYATKDDILLDITDAYLNRLSEDLLAWVDNPEKDTRPERLYHYVLRRGADTESGNLRLYLIGAAVSGDSAVRDRFIDRYRYFRNTLAQRIAARLPDADSGYLAWLLLTVMDGVLVQSQLPNPDFDREDFLQKTVRLLVQNAPAQTKTETEKTL